jgi:cell division transport system permease protein
MQVLTLGVALGVSGLFVLLAWNAHTAMSSLRANLAIEAFFDPDVPSVAASNIVNENIKSLPEITRVVFISKEQALNDYAKMSGEDIEQVLGMNPLPASVKIYLADPTAHSAERLETIVRRIPHIQDVKSDAPLIASMESRSHALDRIAVILCSLLLLAAFFYALTAAQHGADVQKETSRTHSRMGATRWMITAPMIFYSGLAGAIGGIVGMGILLLIHAQVLMAMSDVFIVALTLRESLIACGALACSGAVISVFAAAVTGLRTRS